MGDRSVRQPFEGEAGPWVSDPIEQHPTRPKACDTDALRWIQLPAPLDAVHQQLAKREPHRIANILGQIGLELLHEALDAFGCFARARHQQLHPLGSSRQYFNLSNIAPCGDRALHHFDEPRRLDRLRQKIVCLSTQRAERGVRRVDAGHDDHLGRLSFGDTAREDVETVDAGKTNVEQRHAKIVSFQFVQRGSAVVRRVDTEAGVGQQRAQTFSRGIVVVDDQNVKAIERLVHLSGSKNYARTA